MIHQINKDLFQPRKLAKINPKIKLKIEINPVKSKVRPWVQYEN